MTTQTMPPSSPPAASSPPPRSSAATLLRVLGLGFALLAVASGTLNVVGSLGRDSVSSRASYSGVRSVEVHVQDQSVDVTGGSGSAVTVDRTVSWSLRKPKITERQTGDHLVIRVDCGWFDFGRGCGGQVRLAVPSTADLTL